MNLVLRNKRPVAAASDELGIYDNTLYKWIHQINEYQENAFPGSGNLKPENEELLKIKKKISDVEEENAILKKATANLKKHQKVFFAFIQEHLLRIS